MRTQKTAIMAELVEQLLWTPKVENSSPSRDKKFLPQKIFFAETRQKRSSLKCTTKKSASKNVFSTPRYSNFKSVHIDLDTLYFQYKFFPHLHL